MGIIAFKWVSMLVDETQSFVSFQEVFRSPAGLSWTWHVGAASPEVLLCTATPALPEGVCGRPEGPRLAGRRAGAGGSPQEGN